MTITITQPEVAVALRLAPDAGAIPAPISAVLEWLYPAAQAMIEEHAPSAPDAAHDAAMIRLVGWLYDSDPSSGITSDALNSSGAGNVLRQWRIHRAGALEPSASGGVSPSPTPTPGGGGDVPTPPTSGSFILSVKDGVVTWLKFPIPE